MKLMGIVVGLFALFMFVNTGYAKAKAAKADVVTGKISVVDGNKITIQPKVAKDAPAAAVVILTIDDKTEITVDGAKGKLEDLKKGMTVKASPAATGTATKVDAKNAKAPKKAN